MNYRLLYIMVMVVFLPAYTQVKDTTVNAKTTSVRLSVADSLEIVKIKSNVVIDTGLISIRIKRLKVADSIKNAKDSLNLKDTCYGRAKQ